MTSLTATAPVSDPTEVLERFHPAVRTWFERRFPDGPTEAQAGGLAGDRRGRSTR